MSYNTRASKLTANADPPNRDPPPNRDLSPDRDALPCQEFPLIGNPLVIVEDLDMESEDIEDEKIDEEGPAVDEESKKYIMAGPTEPLTSERANVIRPRKFEEEPLRLECEWDKCTYKSRNYKYFMDHVGGHSPTSTCDVTLQSDGSTKVVMTCKWKGCQWRTEKQIEEVQQHMYLHAFHTRLQCVGKNTILREGLNACRADSSGRNTIPEFGGGLSCAWGECREAFINIQLYYDHIKVHCKGTGKGRYVVGGVHCKWTGCTGVFQNINKLRDHMRSHTQEKLVACPTCGCWFSNRSRLYDHCRRQVPAEEQLFACSACMKCFGTARLLRDHIRSHVNSYRCPHCEMSSTSPSSLHSHIIYKHSQIKPYPCDFAGCAYSAKSSSDLKRHTQTHAQPLYKCDEDGCTFVCKSVTAMSYHFIRKHDENSARYVCHLCSMAYLKGNYLTRHLTSKHKLEWPSGHSRFRYKLGADGLFRLWTVRFECVEVPPTTTDTDTENEAEPTEPAD